MLSKELCRALSRAGPPPPGPAPSVAFPLTGAGVLRSRTGVDAIEPTALLPGQPERWPHPAGPQRASENEPAGVRLPTVVARCSFELWTRKKTAGEIDTWSPGREGKGSRSFQEPGPPSDHSPRKAELWAVGGWAGGPGVDAPASLGPMRVHRSVVREHTHLSTQAPSRLTPTWQGGAGGR